MKRMYSYLLPTNIGTLNGIDTTKYRHSDYARSTAEMGRRWTRRVYRVAPENGESMQPH